MKKKWIFIAAVLFLLTFTVAMAANSVPSDVAPKMPSGGMESGSTPPQMPEGFDPSQMPEGFDPSQMPTDFDPSQMPGRNQAPMKMPEGGEIPATTPAPEATPEVVAEDKEASQTPAPAETPSQAEPNRENAQQKGGFGGGMGGFPMDMQTVQVQEETGVFGFFKTYSTPIFSVLLLALAFVFVVCYKRKNY